MWQKLAKAWIPLLLFTALWGDLIRQLGYHWSTNPQYAFGWSVPFLCGVSFLGSLAGAPFSGACAAAGALALFS